MSRADMLHHADRDDAIELAGELPIIQLPKFDTVGHAGSLGSGACDPDLLGRNIDRGDPGARFARKMNGEAAPAGTDLGNGHAWLQLQFAGGVDQLVLLRLLERVALGVAKIRA